MLDLGCFDETAGEKRDTDAWLHGQIAGVARSVLGIDNSTHIPVDGISTGPTSRIVRGDIAALDASIDPREIDIVVAGELIEHLPNALAFLSGLKAAGHGAEIILTTPNATSLTNVLIAFAGRESNHPDHLQVYSYKTLNTLIARAGFDRWEIVPYVLRYDEMKLRVRSSVRTAISATQIMVNSLETAFPLLAGGLIGHIRRG